MLHPGWDILYFPELLAVLAADLNQETFLDMTVTQGLPFGEVDC
jgi:hypothetical protein